MPSIQFAPNYRLEIDLPAELADGTDLPQGIDQFWTALAQVAFSPQPQIDGGFRAINLPAELSDVPPNIQTFWLALRPILVQILDGHPTLKGKRQGRYGRVPPHATLLSQFGAEMLEKDAETGKPNWQLFEAARDQNYAIWTLRQFFDFCTGNGFSI